MTLIVHPDYHAVPILERNGIRWIPPSQAKRQDIRPLRIGILNIMPLGEKYEFNILHPLGLSVLQLEPIWIRLESHNYKSWEPKHVDDIYVTYEEAMRDQPLDGLILTGAPVETIDFEDVYYWEEIKTILSDARKNIPSTLGLCWAGFVMAYLEGVKKLNYDHKLFGVFELKNLAPDHPIIGELDDVFFCPQSRHAGMPDEAMEEASEFGRLNCWPTGRKLVIRFFPLPMTVLSHIPGILNTMQPDLLKKLNEITETQRYQRPQILILTIPSTAGVHIATLFLHSGSAIVISK